MIKHFISKSCKGEKCVSCGHPATHKIEEYMFLDEPNPHRHPMTAYLCCLHFNSAFNLPVWSCLDDKEELHDDI